VLGHSTLTVKAPRRTSIQIGVSAATFGATGNAMNASPGDASALTDLLTPFWRHDQRDYHLHAVEAVIARVTEGTLVLLLERRIGLELSARQVLPQHIEGRTK